MTRRHALLLLLALAAAPGTLRAAEERYVVRPGETLESIAAKAYGNAELGDWLAALNRLDARPRPGAELHLPGADWYTTVPGDDWAALAERALGSRDLAEDLARLNGRALDAPLEPDQRVRLPAVAPYRIVAGDSLARVSRRFYASPELAPLLARMNGLANAGHIMTGRTIRVPIPHVIALEGAADSAAAEPAGPAPVPETAPTESSPPPAEPAEAQAEERSADTPKPPASARKPKPERAPAVDIATAARREPDRPAIAPVSSPPPARPTAPEFADALRGAGNAYLDGRYDAALATLERLREDVLARGTPAERSALLRQLAFVYVAFDRNADACAAWRALGRVDGETSLDPAEISPKIRSAVAGCSR